MEKINKMVKVELDFCDSVNGKKDAENYEKEFGVKAELVSECGVNGFMVFSFEGEKSDIENLLKEYGY